MEFNPFGRQEIPLTVEQRAEVVETVEEIEAQLKDPKKRYANAFRKLQEAGTLEELDKFELEYLVEMQQNLVAWKQKLDEMFKNRDRVDMYDEEVLRQVNARLYELSEEFEKLESAK